MRAMIAARNDGVPMFRHPLSCRRALPHSFALFCNVPGTFATRCRKCPIAFALRVFAFQELS